MRYHLKVESILCAVTIASISLSWCTPCLAERSNDAATLVAGIKQETALKGITNQTKKRPKIGLALGGGGTRGAAHIGVMRVLQKRGIPIDCIAGTSAGAIVGGFYCAGLPLDKIEELVGKIKSSYYTVPIWLRVSLVPFFLIPHLVHHHYDGLYRGNKFATCINKTVGPDKQKIEDLNIPFCAVAASLVDGKAHSISSGNLGKALQASSAIPVLRRPVEMCDDLYVDGGIVNNLPVDEARKLGADIVIAVDVDERLFRVPGADNLTGFKKIGSVGNRAISLILSRVDEDQVKRADILIQPNVNGIRIWSTRQSDINHAIKAGEQAAEEIADKIEALIRQRSSTMDTAEAAMELQPEDK